MFGVKLLQGGAGKAATVASKVALACPPTGCGGYPKSLACPVGQGMVATGKGALTSFTGASAGTTKTLITAKVAASSTGTGVKIAALAGTIGGIGSTFYDNNTDTSNLTFTDSTDQAVYLKMVDDIDF